jgi:hypothetical protein
LTITTDHGDVVDVDIDLEELDFSTQSDVVRLSQAVQEAMIEAIGEDEVSQ